MNCCPFLLFNLATLSSERNSLPGTKETTSSDSRYWSLSGSQFDSCSCVECTRMFPSCIPADLCGLILEFADDEKEINTAFAITESIQEQHPVHLDNFTNYPNFSINRTLASWGFGPNDFEVILSIHDSILLASKISQEYEGRCEFVFTKKSLLYDLGVVVNKDMVYCIGDITDVVCEACNAPMAYGFMFDFILYNYYFPNGVVTLVDYDMFLFHHEVWKRRPEFMKRMVSLNNYQKKLNWIRYDTGQIVSWDEWIIWREQL